MIIRDHCRPGTRNNPDGALPAQPWPDDCVVQWGGQGVVFDASGTYRTAFFEAFPTDPATFIRGQGPDVATAEAEAWAKFARQRDCAGHQLERRGYRNGAGICANCGLFISRAFEPLEDPDTSGTLGRALNGDIEALGKILSEFQNASKDPARPTV